MNPLQSRAANTQTEIGILQQKLPERLAEVLRRALMSTGGNGAAIALQHKNGMVTRARAGCAPDLGSHVNLDGSFAGLCVRTGQTLHSGHLPTDPRADGAAWRALNVSSMVVTPVRKGEAVVGVLAVFSQKPHAFQQCHGVALEILALVLDSAMAANPASRPPQVRRTSGTESAAELPAATHKLSQALEMIPSRLPVTAFPARPSPVASSLSSAAGAAKNLDATTPVARTSREETAAALPRKAPQAPAATPTLRPDAALPPVPSPHGHGRGRNRAPATVQHPPFRRLSAFLCRRRADRESASVRSTTIAQLGPQSRSSLRGHSLRLIAAYAAVLLLIVALGTYGFDYYILAAAARPYSPKHLLLKPSGVVGVKLGLSGLAIFFLIFLYPLRKRWSWLLCQGSTKHWMDFHVLLGLAAPLVIAFHASFKFRGCAGMAFWTMSAVAFSGVAGRYLYGQIPRRVSAAELSLKESRDLQEKYTTELSSQHLIHESDLQALFRLPPEKQVSRMPVVVALAYIVLLDLLRPWRIARLRRRTLTVSETLFSLGGLLRSSNLELERVVEIAHAQAALSKRLAFLARAQQVFHMWHVVHRPLSCSFVVLAIIHIGVVWLLGFV